MFRNDLLKWTKRDWRSLKYTASGVFSSNASNGWFSSVNMLQSVFMVQAITTWLLIQPHSLVARALRAPRPLGAVAAGPRPHFV